MTTAHSDDPLIIAGRSFQSRLIIGTGKYASYAQNREAAEAAGVEMVTVALRRVNLSNPDEDRLSDHVKPDKYSYLPNTAGCFTADQAVRPLRFQTSQQPNGVRRHVVFRTKASIRRPRKTHVRPIRRK